MTKTKTCPACRSQVDADAQHCPNCPHSFFSDEGVQEHRKGRSRQWPYLVLAVALFFVGAYKAINFVIKYADSDDRDYKNNPIERAVEGVGVSTAPTKLTPEQQAQKAEDEKVREAVRRATASGRVTVVPAEDATAAASQDAGPAAGSTAQAPAAAAAPPAPDDSGAGDGTIVISHSAARGAEEAPAKEWRLRGYVYDLVTLKPVSHATLVLKDAELNRRFELVTGADGRYRTTVPPLPGRGYAVSVRAADYAETYLDPGTDGVREKSEDERRQLAQELTHAMDAPYTVQGLGRTPVETDFYLAPTRPR